MSRKVIFRADGNLETGYGHFVRCLGIAGLINEDFDCVFATKKPTPYQFAEIAKVCNGVIELKEDDSHFDEFLSHLCEGDIVVLDDYNSTEEYQRRIRDKGCKLIYIDDHNDKHYVCDALINNIPGFEAGSFNKEDYTKLYLGTDYALLRKEFFNPELRQLKKKTNTVFAAFGGSDFYNVSEKIVTLLNEINPGLKMNLLIGDAYKFMHKLTKFDNVAIHKNLSAEEVATLIAESEVCIVPASSLLNETASIGSRILLGYFADNQKQPYNYFIDNKMALPLGDLREVHLDLLKDKLEEVLQSDTIIENQKERYRYQQADNLRNIFYDV